MPRAGGRLTRSPEAYGDLWSCPKTSRNIGQRYGSAVSIRLTKANLLASTRGHGGPSGTHGLPASISKTPRRASVPAAPCRRYRCVRGCSGPRRGCALMPVRVAANQSRLRRVRCRIQILPKVGLAAVAWALGMIERQKLALRRFALDRRRQRRRFNQRQLGLAPRFHGAATFRRRASNSVRLSLPSQ